MAVTASAVWRIRAGGSDANGGGYDAAIAGAGTDYSQQNAAQASGSNGTASATTTFTDATANAFTAAMVGNAIWIASGAGFTVGAYFITGYTSSSVVTLDRSPGTGTVALWKCGGGWATFVNTQNNAPIVTGNTIYVRAGGSATPGSPDYTWTTNTFGGASGSSTVGYIRVLAENGRPYVATGGNQFGYGQNFFIIVGIYFVNAQSLIWGATGSHWIDCVFDQFGADRNFFNGGSGHFIRCEFMSSVANAGAAGTSNLINTNGQYFRFYECNIHDGWGNGVYLGGSGYQNNTALINCTVAKNKGNGISVGDTSNDNVTVIRNCTIDGNGGHGIVIRDANTLASVMIMNCIISNHSVAAKYGIQCNFNTQAINDQMAGSVDYNCYYNNTVNALNLTVGTTTAAGIPKHDTVGTDPQYVSAAAETYGIGSNLVGLSAPVSANRKSGMTASTSALSPGAYQPAAAAATYVINRMTTIYGDDYAA